MESENKRLKVLIVILLVFLVAFGGYYFYNKVVEKNNSGTTNNEIITNENSNINEIKLDQIKEIFGMVYSYYELPVVYCGKSDSASVNIYGTDRHASAEFSTYEEMLNSLKKYMSLEVITSKTPWAATTKENYLEQDGKLYCTETNKGYLYEFGNITIEITSHTESKVTCVATMELIDPDGNKTYDKVNLILENKDSSWIVTSYSK